MKPRLREDVHYLPLAGSSGVLVITPWPEKRRFTVEGPQAYEGLRRLEPFLTGDQTVDELCHNLDQRWQEWVRSIIRMLHREGAVRDAANDLPHTLSPDMRQAYAPMIAFIARHLDSPEHRFQRYQESSPLVIGSGQLLGPLLQALLVTGVEQVAAIVTAEVSTDVPRIWEVLEATVGPTARERLRIDHGDLSDIPALTTGGVLHVSDLPMLDRLEALADRCAQEGTGFGQATVIDDHALVGPVGMADELGLDWLPTLERRIAADSGGLRLDESANPVGEYLAGPTAAVVANHLGVAFLNHLTGLSSEVSTQFVEVDLETLVAQLTPIREAASASEPVRA